MLILIPYKSTTVLERNLNVQILFYINKKYVFDHTFNISVNYYILFTFYQKTNRNNRTLYNFYSWKTLIYTGHYRIVIQIANSHVTWYFIAMTEI